MMKTKTYFGGITLLLLSVVFAIAIAFYSSSSPAAPAVAWTPASIAQEIKPGETVEVSVSFTASKNLQDVVVRVVPKIKPYVQADPVVLGNVSKGETREIVLTISAPSDVQPATFEGTVQLRRNSGPNKNYAKPLPVTVNVVENGGNRVVDPNTGVSFEVPPGFESRQGVGYFAIVDSLSPILPAFLAVTPFQPINDLSGLSHEEVLIEIYESRLETDGIVRVIGFHSGGVELEIQEFAKYRFYLYDSSSNVGIEFSTGYDDVFSSDVFQQILQSIEF